jgi:hypothetical protein
MASTWKKLNRTAAEAVADQRRELREIREGTMPTPSTLNQYNAGNEERGLAFPHMTEETERLWDEEFYKVIDGTQMLMPTPKDRKEMKEGDSPYHFDSGKARVDQLPPRALTKVAEIFGYGAKKYGDWNWAQHASEWKWGQLVGSTLRHLYSWMAREDYDLESGHHHLAHAGANVLMLLELILTHNGTDDRNPIGS